MFESMPTLSELGANYSSFPLAFGDEYGGYEVRVIGVSKETAVYFSTGKTSILDMGEVLTEESAYTRESISVKCSNECLAVQYIKVLQDDSTSRELGNFMVVLTPDTQFSGNVAFATPSYSSFSSKITAISLVVDHYPVTTIYLNGVSLSYLDWHSVDESSNWHAFVQIAPGDYTLISLKPFER